MLYYLQAHAEAGPLPVRFIAGVHHDSSVAAIVRDESPFTRAEDLGGCRIGGPQGSGGLGWLLRECCDGFDRRGLDPPVIRPLQYRDAVAALRDGRVDAVPYLAELTPLLARAAGVPLRAIPVGAPVYTSGMVAGDWVPPDVVERMQRALQATLCRQRDDPHRGIGLLEARHPEVNIDDAVASWRALETYVFRTQRPGGLDRKRWADSIRHLAAVHALGPAPPEGEPLVHHHHP